MSGVAAVFVAVVPLVPLVLVLMERKVSAWIQDRVGPMRVGPWGLLQTLADGVKLIFKEDLIPPQADKFLFRRIDFFGIFWENDKLQHLNL